MEPAKPLVTPAQAREHLRRTGQSVAGWARKHGVDQALTHEVLRGAKKGHYGESHRIAVLLGIKDGELGEETPKAKGAAR